MPLLKAKPKCGSELRCSDFNYCDYYFKIHVGLNGHANTSTTGVIAKGVLYAQQLNDCLM